MSGVRFRHVLTREALIDGIRPPRRQALATAALRELDERRGAASNNHSLLPSPDEDSGLAADLAAQAGDRLRAGRLHAASGQRALEDGALATAVASLRQAGALLEGSAESVPVALTLVRALTAAGQVDNALPEGERLVAALRTSTDPDRDQILARVLVALADTAVAAARWELADRYLTDAGLPDPTRGPQLNAHSLVLSAEIAFAADRADDAHTLLERPLADEEVEPEVRCRAFELLGRIERTRDLGAAREAFERSLSTAQAAGLPVRVLQALHELGTIDLLDHAGTRRLDQAREIAQRLGAMGTLAILDLQLVAAYLSRFRTDEAERHARAAVAVSERLGLQSVCAKALAGLAETCVQRRDRSGAERYLALAVVADPSDRFTAAFAWGQCRGMLSLFDDDWPTALECFARGIEQLEGVAHAEPVEFRALWPLLLAHFADPRADGALSVASASGLRIAFANRGLLGYARAILAGRAGRREQAAELALSADAYLARFPVWADLARLCAAEAAIADGWGRPQRWLHDASATFTHLGLVPLASHCQRLLTGLDGGTPPAVTAREADVLRLLTQGLANKEIGAALHISPRTVEKHVESLLRKTGTRSRTQLAAQAAGRRNT